MKLLALVLVLVPAFALADPSLWPQPQVATFGSETISIPSGGFSWGSTFISTLAQGIKRYDDIIFGDHRVDWTGTSGEKISVDFEIAESDETLDQDTKEIYWLNADSTGVKIKAMTAYGGLRALETLSQLMQFNLTTGTFEIPNTPLAITDYPRFSYRGLLVDTSRHFLPVRVLHRIIDSMSFSKLNVMHWHIVDAQSFPLEVKSFPGLWDGAYSQEERYTQNQVKDLIEYARLRGVRVMPEFDGPGHAYAWGVGYPELLPQGYATAKGCAATCPPEAGNPCNVPLDPSKDFTYTVIKGLYEEVSGLFEEQFLHLGGDEVATECWENSSEIKQWMTANNMTTYDDAYMFFVQRAHEYALQYDRTPVAWEEVFNHFGTQLNPKTIIHIWLDHATLQKVVANGYRGILSNQDVWYLDHLGTLWEQFYLNEPHQNITDSKQQELVLGGEVCMWGETMDGSDALATIWPRAAAAAERLWSARDVNDTDKAFPRLLNFRCLLNQRGVGAAPVNANGRAAPSQPGACHQAV